MSFRTRPEDNHGGCKADVFRQTVRVKVRQLPQRCTQKRVTISEVAADWHEILTPQPAQLITRPSIVRACEQLDPRCTMHANTPSPRSATLGLYHTDRPWVLIMFRPAEGRRLSWPEHGVNWQRAQNCLLMSRAEIQTAT